jgi:hypothetical protein
MLGNVRRLHSIAILHAFAARPPRCWLLATALLLQPRTSARAALPRYRPTVWIVANMPRTQAMMVLGLLATGCASTPLAIAPLLAVSQRSPVVKCCVFPVLARLLLVQPALGNKADHDKLMERSTKKKVRVGLHNKLKVDILVFDHTHDHGECRHAA